VEHAIVVAAVELAVVEIEIGNAEVSGRGYGPIKLAEVEDIAARRQHVLARYGFATSSASLTRLGSSSHVAAAWLKSRFSVFT
jgi:hypothetical protein